MGGAPRFRNVKLEVDAKTGGKVSGIAVTLGLPLPLERPVFYAREVLDESGQNTDPARVTMASDYQLPVFSAASPADTEKSFIRYKLGAGVAPAEIDAAAASPFGMPVKDPAPFLLYTRQDVNGDGVIDGEDPVPDSDLLPSLFPLAIFAKLEDGEPLVSQARPTVILQGLTMYQSLAATAFAAPDLADPSDEVLVGLRPAVLCLDPTDASKAGFLVASHKTDSMNNDLIADEAQVKANLGAQFGRKIEIVYACLPQGQYAANLIYSTGQAWTIPNRPASAPSGRERDGTTCGSRARSHRKALLSVGRRPIRRTAANPTPAACLP
jgi:hypothetical protein